MTHTTAAVLTGVSRVALGAALLLAAGTVAAQTAPVATTPQGAPVPPPVQATTDQPTQPAQADDASGPDIVVTGIRASLANALSAKRDSAQVLDAISAEDIGKFPDKNVGEALQRVTGVQITRAGGEGSGVSIRGADPALNRVEINGQTALSTAAGVASRSVEFRDIPAEFVSRLEVVKSATADMTEGGLGGTVRIITRRPFDAKEGFLSGSAQAVYGDLADRVDPKFALIGSKLFANDTIGVLMSGTYEKRSLWYDQARTTGWRQIERFPTSATNPASTGCLAARNQARCVDIDNNGFGDFFPDIPRYVINRELTERYAFNGIVEWRPSDDVRAFVEGTYTRGKQKIDSQFLQLSTTQAVANGGVDLANTTLGEDQTVDKVTFIGAAGAPGGLSATYRNILGVIDRQQFNGQVGADWDVTDQFKITGRAAYAKAKAYNNEINATAVAQGLSSITVDYSNDQQAPNITLPIDVATTQGLTQFIVLRRPRYNEQQEIDLKLDGEYKPESWLTSLKFGVQKRDVKVTSRLFDGTKTYNAFVANTPGRGNITSNTYASGSSQTVTDSTGTTTDILNQIQSIVGPNATLGDHDFFNTGDLGFDGIKRWLNLGMNVANAAGIPDPFVNPVAADTWRVTDKNLAAYVSAAFELEPLGKRLTGVVGARVINTKTDTRGSIVSAPAGTRPGSVTPFTSKGEYTEFLPSLNLKLELIPNKLQLRGTATEVIARPAPSDLAPRFTLDNVGFTGSRGNPALQPYRARQYDLGVEWYLSRVNFVSATLFRKDISSFVDRTTQQEVIDGVNYTITLPVNGTSKVQINGAEFGGQYAFDFLPKPFDGFGVTANYTWSDDKGYNQKDYFTGDALTFPGLSKHSYNLSGYYDNGSLSARLSYNWRSRYLIAALDRGNNPAVGEPFGQWDASASANLTEKVSLFLEGVNVFNAQRTENAASIYRRNIIETYGRRVYGGVRVKF
ncbi:TonB-dependent receptor [Sphingomonas mollis]|uniref:TonB-dependent receptor n=1 Tax=Sphingomonas mollis TaxID=2795726 RepID=A0ABS0XR39_9SPHN|nr:TonB-dependent receptor [Sphingomonas sp. BT553]MBJ6122496.1 TonB-dependent receptor [Sphingomonas sp. BT553]